jgi:hypothetical protein
MPYPDCEQHHGACIFIPQTSNLKPQPSTRNPKPGTRNLQPSILDPQPSTRNPKPETLKIQPSTFNPQPKTPNTDNRKTQRQPATAAHMSTARGATSAWSRSPRYQPGERHQSPCQTLSRRGLVRGFVISKPETLNTKRHGLPSSTTARGRGTIHVDHPGKTIFLSEYGDENYYTDALLLLV